MHSRGAERFRTHTHAALKGVNCAFRAATCGSEWRNFAHRAESVLHIRSTLNMQAAFFLENNIYW